MNALSQRSEEAGSEHWATSDSAGLLQREPGRVVRSDSVSSLSWSGGPAIIGITLRPVTLRPRLSASLPLSEPEIAYPRRSTSVLRQLAAIGTRSVCAAIWKRYAFVVALWSSVGHKQLPSGENATWVLLRAKHRHRPFGRIGPISPGRRPGAETNTAE